MIFSLKQNLFVLIKLSLSNEKSDVNEKQ